MATGSLFPSRRVQSMALGVLMFLVLLASLGAAYAVTVARSHPDARLGATLAVGQLRLNLPDGWERVEDHVLPPEWGAHVLVDRNRPQRRLVAVRVDSAERMDGLTVALNVLTLLLGPDLASRGRAVAAAVPHAQFEAVWISLHTGRRLHLAADLTADQRVHWFLYMTDEAAEGESFGRLHQYDLALLWRIAQEAELVPASP